MTFRRVISTALAALVAAAMPQIAAAQYQNNTQQQTVTCSSTGYERQYCRVDTRNGVQLTRRTSDAACDQNSTWGYDANGIWVSRGCSAEFTVNSYASGQYGNAGTYNNGQYGNNSVAQTVTCTSRRSTSSRKYCAADTENGATVTLQQQTSNATCTQNQSWGYDDEGVWVSSGCGGVFAVNPANTGYNNGRGEHNGGYGRRRDSGQYATGDNTAQTIRCSSTGNSSNRQYCPVDARGGVRMQREYSSSVCRQGSNWGYDNGGVWVSNGCSADFQTYATGTRRSYSGRTTIIPSGTQVSIRADEAIDSKNAYVGQRYAADVASDVTDSSGTVIIPRGSQAELILHDANDPSNNNPNTNNNQNLVLDLDSVTVNGQRYIVSTQDVNSTGSGIGANKKTGEYVGGGALLGAIIGAVAGGGKGAAIGAAVGAGAGAGGVILTKGKNVNVPVETVLNFKLDQDLTLQGVR